MMSRMMAFTCLKGGHVEEIFKQWSINCKGCHSETFVEFWTYPILFLNFPVSLNLQAYEFKFLIKEPQFKR
jgi:hypothetical protein